MGLYAQKTTLQNFPSGRFSSRNAAAYLFFIKNDLRVHTQRNKCVAHGRKTGQNFCTQEPFKIQVSLSTLMLRFLITNQIQEFPLFRTYFMPFACLLERTCGKIFVIYNDIKNGINVHLFWMNLGKLK